MRKLLDYTNTGRWQTVMAGPAPEESATAAPDTRVRPASLAIRRLLDYTRTGHWRTITVPAGGTASELADALLARSTDSGELAQQLSDDSFFGVDVHEIPAEKWPEIAPLFPR
jgi:hypothetical protein